jgi:3-oxoadipate enol-lactonase
MAFAELKDLRMHYEVAGPVGAPVLVFSNSLGTDLSMWDVQAVEFAKKYRVVRYDKRGHGQSSSPAGPYTIEMLGRDVVGLLDFLEFDSVHFCGLSIGGQTGMWLGVNAAQRLNKLVLSNTAAKIGTTDGWNVRIETVSTSGMKSVAATVVERWFTVGFRAEEPAEVSRIQRVLENANVRGYAGCCAAVRDFDYREKVGEIRTSTMAIAGTHDPATPPGDTRWVADRIAGSRFVELNASHLSNIEAHERFSAELGAFLAA